MSSSKLASELHFESDDRPRLQQEQLIELCNGNEARASIRKRNWVIYVKQNSDACPRLNASIFRVPKVLVKDKTKGEAYVPQRISLGPYHEGKAELLPMESHKERAMHRMMTRFNINLNNDPYSMDFAVCAKKEIMQLEDAIRNIYEEKISFDGDMLAWMLVLDGCFVLEILRTSSGSCLASNCHEHFFKRAKINYTASDTLTDIVKLENQIPFIVLRKLLNLELASSDIDGELKLFEVLVAPFLTRFSPFTDKIDKENAYEMKIYQGEQEIHLLGLLHRFIMSLDGHDEDKTPNSEESRSGNKRIRPALELRMAGIRFRARVRGIRENDFDEEKAIIYLPQITIEDSTEIVFRNLIAFEMCKRFPINYVVRYVDLMDQLINSEEDAVLLRKEGIITNFLGSDGEVAQLFNSLGKGVNLSRQDVFNELTYKVNRHCKTHEYAQFVREQFSSPWKTVRVGSIVLLMLTIVQTIISILTLHK